MRCLATTWFVSWEDAHTGPEHAECRECGFKYGSVEERVVDPQSGAVKFVQRPVLEPEVWLGAKAKMQADFVRELYGLDIANGRSPGYGAAKMGLGVQGHGIATKR
jgi:hypothetical protein